MSNDYSKQRLKELRPYIIKSIHDIKLEEYKKEYRDNNGGNEPKKEDINNFISMLIAHGTVKAETDRYIDQWNKKLEKKDNRFKIYHETAFVVFASYLFLSYIFLFILGGQDDPFIKKSFLMNGYNFYNAIILLIYLVISHIVNLKK